jgi:transcriptional regulator with GAF, ATPase, and Fis domain
MVDTEEREAELAQAFADIARQLQAQDSREQTWRQIVQMAGDLLPAFEHAAISSVHRNRRIDTVASSDEVGNIVDQVQYETGQGPCLSAIREDPMYVSGDLGVEERWPQFTRRVVAETGVRSMLSLQLFTSEDALGALNLYSHSRNAFDDRAMAFGGVLAAHAAIAMSAADDHAEVEQLEEALASSRVIGTAQGILMVQARVDQRQAFRILVQGSQRMNMKLRDLAARIVSAEEESGSGPRRGSTEKGAPP